MMRFNSEAIDTDYIAAIYVKAVELVYQSYRIQ